MGDSLGSGVGLVKTEGFIEFVGFIGLVELASSGLGAKSPVVL